MDAPPAAPPDAPPDAPPAPRRPTHLVLSGGGLAGLAYVGALKFLHESGLADGIRHAAGTSMGAWFATAFALGVPPADLERIVHEIFRDPDYVRYEPTALLGLMDTYGLDDGHRFVKPLEHYAAAVPLAPEARRRAISAKMTFREHAGAPPTTFRDVRERFGRDLVVAATCLETGEVVYFGPDATPDAPVLDAVRASMAIPFVLRPVPIGGRHYVDGAFTDNTPYAPFVAAPPPAAPAPPRAVLVFDIQQPFVPPGAPKYPCGNVIEFVALLTAIASKKITVATPTADELAERLDGVRPVLLDACPLPLMRLTCDATGIYFLVRDDDITASIAYGHARAAAWWADAQARAAPTGAS